MTTENPAQVLERQKKRERDSFLETMESLVVAFILAFVFRAYIVEAFVIPTGSMAPKLNGEHLELVCANCGYHYSVGLDREHEGWPPRDSTACCPLCFSRDVTEKRDIQNPCFGDRILVLKYFYDFFEPQRWDVIVFKYPLDPSQNYIKRLIGLPGETVEIKGGNVYITPPGGNKAEIARKTDKAQAALWMPVADTDYWDRARGSRWRPADESSQAQWQWQQMPMTFHPAAGADTGYLVYQHFGPGGRPDAIRDYYAYNNPTAVDPVVNPGARADNICAVGDLDVVADVEMADSGVFEVSIRAFDDTFLFRLPSAGCRLPAEVLRNGAAMSDAAGPLDPLPVGRRVTIEAAHVDQKIILKVNGHRLDLNGDGQANLSDDLTYDVATPRRDDQNQNPLPGDTRIMIGASRSPVTVHRLRVNRDVYYTSRQPQYRRGAAVEGEPFELHDNEFFALGDNSPKSLDSRWWTRDRDQRTDPQVERTAVVPRRNLIGKAFFVYWPAAGARYGIPWRFVPDVTEFRFIR